MRNTWIDFIRFIAMISVFFIHCIFPGQFGIYLRAANSFAVPLFFITSGYFCSFNSVEKLRKKVKTLGSIVLISNIFYMIWDVLYIYLQDDDVENFLYEILSVKKWIIFFVFNESPLRGHLWFLGSLLYCYIILCAIKILKIDKKFNYTWILLGIGLIVQFILTRIAPDKMLIIVRNWFFDGLPFFFMGYYFQDYKEKFQGKIPSRMPLIFIIVILVFLAEIHTVGTDRVYYVMTIILSFLLFIMSVEADAKEPLIVKYLSNIYKQYGSVFYIIQVSIIKTYELLFDTSNVVYLWVKPLIVMMITFGITVFVVEFYKVLSNGCGDR